jgi:hypothetical protein
MRTRTLGTRGPQVSSAASKIAIAGNRYREHLEARTGL